MSISLLADHREFINQVALWYSKEWPEHYGDFDSAVKEVSRSCQRSSLPMGLIAMESGELIGSAALVDEDLESRPEYTPWFTSLYVSRHRRGKSVAKQLIDAGLHCASQLAIENLYIWILSHPGVYERWGWVIVEQSHLGGKPIWILRANVRDLAILRTEPLIDSQTEQYWTRLRAG